VWVLGGDGISAHVSYGLKTKMASIAPSFFLYRFFFLPLPTGGDFSALVYFGVLVKKNSPHAGLLINLPIKNPLFSL